MSKMKVKVVAIRSTSSESSPDHKIWVSAALLRKWGVAPNHSVNMRFGAFRSYVKVVPVNRKRFVRISGELAQGMGLSGSAPMRASFVSSTQTISVGPVIGVIMSRASSKDPNRPFGDTTAFCKELADAAKKVGAFVYFFTPKDISPGRNSIPGWTYDKGWKHGVFPMPDVLHNRLTSRKYERMESVRTLFQEAKTKHGTKVFNEKYLDKTEVFAALKQEPAVSRYLPESHAFTGFDMLKTMSGRHRIVFLKPVRGSLGKGIIRIARLTGGGFACHFSEDQGTRRIGYATLPKVYAAVAPYVKRQKYQIQQGLQLAAVGGRPIDFRALVQKGSTGEWGVTSIVGRIAGPNHFVSNLAKGGTIASMKDAIARSNLPPGTRAKAMAALRKAALAIAEAVDKTIDAHFGELGVDLAVDRSGRVWLLEVNSKPSKNDNTQLNEGKVRPSTKRLIQYARYLAKL